MPIFHRMVVGLILLLIGTVHSRAALMRRMSVEELAAGADHVIEATATDIQSSWDAAQARIYSLIALESVEVIRGNPSRERIYLLVSGGQVGDVSQVSSLTPRFETGVRSVFFISDIPDDTAQHSAFPGIMGDMPVYRLYGHFQGKLDVWTHTAGSPETDTLNVRIIKAGEYLADDGDTSARSVARQTRYPQYVLNEKWQGEAPDVAYKINDSFSYSENAAIRQAAETWNYTGANFEFSYAGTHTRSGDAEYNGTNEILWFDLGTQGTLAEAVWWTINGYIVETDMLFNTNVTWSTSTTPEAGTFDMESVALHEFGHWLSLDHSEYEDAVMWESIGATVIKRELHSDDIAGILAHYPPSRVILLSGDLNFGYLDIGRQANRMLTISNAGTHTLTVHSIDYPDGFSGNWSGMIVSGAYENISVLFSPAAAQTYSGSLRINSDRTSGMNMRGCSGTGVAVSDTLSIDQPKTGPDGFGFKIKGFSGQSYVVEVCVDLKAWLWQPIATNTVSNFDNWFFDTNPSEAKQRLYRVRANSEDIE